MELEPPSNLSAATEMSLYGWGLVMLYATLSALAALAIAIRDGRFRDLPHLVSIAIVGGVVGLGIIGGTGHVRGGIVGNELLLLLVSAGSGLGGRYIELAITRKTASLLGVDPAADLDSIRRFNLPDIDEPAPPDPATDPSQHGSADADQ